MWSQEQPTCLNTKGSIASNRVLWARRRLAEETQQCVLQLPVLAEIGEFDLLTATLQTLHGNSAFSLSCFLWFLIAIVIVKHEHLLGTLELVQVLYVCGAFVGFARSPAKIFKKDGSTILTAKAFNGRIITQWLASCLVDAARNLDQYRAAGEQISVLASCVLLGLVN